MNLPPWSHPGVVDKTIIQTLITAACLAPSEGNDQPWKWLYLEQTLFLFNDTGRTGLTPDDTVSQIALGAATENLLLKAGSLGLEVLAVFFPPSPGKPLASFRIYKDETVNRKKDDPFKNLAEYISSRTTNRKVAGRSDIDRQVLQELSDAAESIQGAKLTFLTGLPEIQEMGELIAKTDRLRLLHPDEHQRYMSQFRWLPQDHARSRDGIDATSLELSPSEFAELKLAKSPEVLRHLIHWKGGRVFEKPALRRIPSVSAFGLLTMKGTHTNPFFEGGRALERVWLTATKLQKGLQPISSPLSMFARLDHGTEKNMLPEMKEELNLLKHQYVKLFAVESAAADVCLFRLCQFEKPALPLKTLRLNMEDVLLLK
jgi:hypothetical protein